MQHSPAMQLSREIARGLAPVVDLVFPPRCPVCGEGIAEQRGLCAECWSDLVIPGEPACATCQRPLGDLERDEGTQCAPCLANPPRHAGIAAGVLYTEPARKLVLAFKHGRRIALAPMLARLAAARLPELEGEWLAIPVPLHRSRIWKRGYNQSALLARQVAKLRGAELLVDGLIRTKATPPLGGLGRKERAKTLQGAVEVSPRRRERIKGAQILLVDDVLTSGATTDACTRALLKAGAKSVRIVCFARVMNEAL